MIIKENLGNHRFQTAFEVFSSDSSKEPSISGSSLSGIPSSRVKSERYSEYEIGDMAALLGIGYATGTQIIQLVTVTEHHRTV